MAVKKRETRLHPSPKKKGQGPCRQTIWRWANKKTVTSRQWHRDFQAHLTEAQERTLIGWIESMTKAQLPPSPGMVKSFGERVCGYSFGKNWHARFIARWRDEIVEKWLPGMDSCRVIADANMHCYRIWYERVSLYVFKLIITDVFGLAKGDLRYVSN
jgi:hypothetical protein